MVRKILPLLLVLLGLSLAACGPYGEVEQGRVVKYDNTVTPAVAWIIKDNGKDDRNPEYTVLPAHAFQIPAERGEMGQEPKVGKRVKLDVEARIITMYNFEKKDFDKLPFELVNNDRDVSVRKRHPLVWDSNTGKAREFPQINEAEQTITIYSRRQEMLSTIKLAPEDFAKYQAKDWDAGDEVRIYFKEGPKDGKPGKSLRFMNVTRTDFSKR